MTMSNDKTAPGLTAEQRATLENHAAECGHGFALCAALNLLDAQAAALEAMTEQRDEYWRSAMTIRDDLRAKLEAAEAKLRAVEFMSCGCDNGGPHDDVCHFCELAAAAKVSP